jgi:hypothetical protein
MRQYGVQAVGARAKCGQIGKACRHREVLKKRIFILRSTQLLWGNHGCSDTPNAEHYRGGACEQTEQYKWAASSSATIESAIDT